MTTAANGGINAAVVGAAATPAINDRVTQSTKILTPASMRLMWHEEICGL